MSNRDDLAALVDKAMDTSGVHWWKGTGTARVGESVADAILADGWVRLADGRRSWHCLPEWSEFGSECLDEDDRDDRQHIHDEHYGCGQVVVFDAVAADV